MNSLLMLVSLFYLAGTFWYYELDWKNKRIVFVVPSEVLYFMATALMIVFFYFVYWGKVVLVYSGYLYVYLFIYLHIYIYNPVYNSVIFIIPL